MRLLDSNTAALNAHEHRELQREASHEIALAAQRRDGINAVAKYKADILESDEWLADICSDLSESGHLKDIAYLALCERSDPANGEAASMLTTLLDRLAERCAEQMAEKHGGVYHPDWIERDMEYQQSLLNLTAYKEQLSR